MNDSQGLEASDFVVRRKRKRHTSTSFCCCRQPSIDFLEDFQGLISLDSTSGYSDGLLDFSPGDAIHMDPDDEPSLSVRECPLANRDNSSETFVTSSEPHVSLVSSPLSPDTGTILKNHHNAKAKKRKTYRARYRVLSDSNEDIASCADILQKRAVRDSPSRAPESARENADNGTPEPHISQKSRRQLRRKPEKQRRRCLAERLIDAVVRTSGQSSEELLQAGCKDGVLRIPITMETVPRSLIPDKPRKWSLVDPRKVVTPFQASTFYGASKTMTGQTPTSYERIAFCREVTEGAVDIDVQTLESSSPCQKRVRRRSVMKKSRVRLCEPLKLDVVSIDTVNKRRLSSKSRTKVSTPKADSRCPRLPLECKTLEEQEVHLGRRPLDMIPVPTRLSSVIVAAKKPDGAAAYSSNLPRQNSQSQADLGGLLLATMPPPAASIPRCNIFEFPISPTALSPVSSSESHD